MVDSSSFLFDHVNRFNIVIVISNHNQYAVAHVITDVLLNITILGLAHHVDTTPSMFCVCECMRGFTISPTS